MSIQKKSLISTLKTARKANVASAPLTHVESDTSEGKNAKVFAKSTGKYLAKSTGKYLAKSTGKYLAKSTGRAYGKK
jgi:hypothetical protein